MIRFDHMHVIHQDPAYTSSLEKLLFLADVFWTGLEINAPPPPPVEKRGQNSAVDQDGKEEEEESVASSGSLIIPQDHKKSAYLWQKAAATGETEGEEEEGERLRRDEALYNYANCLLHGHGVPGMS